MPSLFIGVYTALYPYQAQTDQELELAPGDLLYVLEKSTEDDWWKVKKRVPGAEAEEPIGLVPNNYIQEAPVISSARALYSYDRQTEEELSFMENDVFDVYDTSDSDWILVGSKKSSEFGFVPSNYIQIGETAPTNTALPAVEQPPVSSSTFGQGPVSNYVPPPPPATFVPQDKPLPKMPQEPQPEPSQDREPERERYDRRNPSYSRDDEEEEEEAPPLPTRPRDESFSPAPQVPSSSSKPAKPDRDQNFYNWYVQEVDGRKKYKATLSIGNGSIMYSSTRTDSNAQQWPIDDILNYNSEKKHVFLELQHPSLSLDLHAGSKETAEEITSVLGDLAGAVKAVGLREVIAAAKSAGQKMGKVLYDFEAQQDDEVSAKEGENIFILDSERSREWWLIRNAQGREGMIPSSYIEVAPEPTSSKRLSFYPSRSKSKSEKPKRRSSYFSKKDKERDREEREQREYDLAKEREFQRQEARRRENESRTDKRGVRASKSKPDANKIRTWTDRSGAFKVDAAFLGCVDGKIHLHKVNGVKIAVAASKMSLEDLDYVERLTGMSLDDDKPLADVRKAAKSSGVRKTVVEPVPGGLSTGEPARPAEPVVTKTHVPATDPRAVSSNQPTVPEFDWFGFFLDCGVDINNCQRYSINFNRDKMDESILPDITPDVLRTLGLKEGDILRVTKKIDEKYDRNKQGQPKGGLFSNEDGSLRNNTSKPQEAPVVAMAQQPAESVQLVQSAAGFTDDAWAVKSVQPPVQAPVQPPVQPPVQAPVQPPVQPPAQESVPPPPPPPTYPSNPPAASSSASVSSLAPQPQPQPTGALKDFLDFVPLKPQQTAAAAKSQSQPQNQNQSQNGTILTIPVTIPIAIQPMPTGLGAQATGGFVREPLNPFLTGAVGSQMTGPMVGQMTGPMVGQMTGPMVGQMTGPMVGQMTGPMVGQITGPMVGQMTGPMTSQMTGPMVSQMTGPMVGQLTGNPFLSSSTTGFAAAAPLTSFATGVSATPGFVPLFGNGQAPTPFGNVQAPMTSFGTVQPTTPFGTQTPTTFGTQPITQFGTQPTTPFGTAQPPTTFGTTQPPTTFGTTQPPMTSFGTQPPSVSQLGTQLSSISLQPANPFQQQPLQTQPTGFGFGNAQAPMTSFGNGFGQQQPFPALTATPTGRRANLGAATAQNPFGF